MSIQYNVHQAKTNLSSILEKVRKGEDVIIAKAGTPVARLISIKSQKPRRPGSIKAKLSDSFFDPLPEEELKAWES